MVLRNMMFVIWLVKCFYDLFKSVLIWKMLMMKLVYGVGEDEVGFVVKIG